MRIGGGTRFTAIAATAAISTYISSKDGNRPQLIRAAFAENRELEMVARTDVISFPSSAKGMEEVTKILVADFGGQYKMLRTFCLSRPSSPDAFSLRLARRDVGKAGGAVRVGCGHYDWYFGFDEHRQVKNLSSTSKRCVFFQNPEQALEPIMQRLAALPYPWCSSTQACEVIPAIDTLRTIERFLALEKKDNAATV